MAAASETAPREGKRSETATRIALTINSTVPAIYVSTQAKSECWLSRAFVKCEAGFIKTTVQLVLESGIRKRFAFSQSTHARKARQKSQASICWVSARSRAFRYVHGSICT